MLAYVLGRPIPSASSVRTRLASVKRAGGFVSCETASSWRQARRDSIGKRRQGRLLVVHRGFGIVDAFDVSPKVTGELDVPARRAELGVARGDRHRLKQELRIDHLRGDGPLPDHGVQVRLRVRRARVPRLCASRCRQGGSPRGLPARCGSWWCRCVPMLRGKRRRTVREHISCTAVIASRESCTLSVRMYVM